MDKDKIYELLKAREQADHELEQMRSAVTILFSDIKGSTAYFEKKGDVEGLAMVQRHNELLMPRIIECGGRVVKTIGDSIMACFGDPVGAVTAAAEMQRTLDNDRAGRSEPEQIHIRVGLHTGFGLFKGDDVFGDVVNAASRVQHQAQPDQILITDVLLDAAKSAGFQVARLGKAELKGKDEPIDLYAMAWSQFANDQLVEELQAQYERKLKDMKRIQERIEEDFEKARDQWRSERRQMNNEIEQLEESIERSREAARQQVSEDLQSEIRFQLEEALRLCQRTEEELVAATGKWDIERNNLRAQIASMQGAVIEAMERSNNPSRTALAVREHLDTRVAEAKREWIIEWEGERKRFTAEIERLKKSARLPDERKEAARLALLEKLGKLPAGSSVSQKTKSPDEWER
jgi:class 3 adenylate cyclase